MSIKKVPNILNVCVVDSEEVLTISTGSKKTHYECSESKLFDALTDAVKTSGGYFNLYMATYPSVLISIYARKDILAEHKDWLIKQITCTLQSYHSIGNVRVR